MTQLEILKLAFIGICRKIEREEEINEITRQEHGRDNELSLEKIKRYEQDMDEISKMIKAEEQKGVSDEI